MRKFSVYELKNTKTNIKRVQSQYEFYYIDTDCILVYTDKEQPERSKLVQNIKILSSNQLSWINDCNLKLTEQMLSEHRDTQKMMQSFLDSFAKELSLEQERMNDNKVVTEA